MTLRVVVHDDGLQGKTHTVSHSPGRATRAVLTQNSVDMIPLLQCNKHDKVDVTATPRRPRPARLQLTLLRHNEGQIGERDHHSQLQWGVLVQLRMAVDLKHTPAS